jgi:integrase
MRSRTGSLTKKGGLFYLVVSERDPLTGKRKRIWLATGASTRRDAEAKAAELNAPFVARDRADRLAHIAGQVDAAQVQADALEDAITPGLKIKDAFDAYERHTDRPDAGEATLDQYRCQWGRFEKWLAKVHPEVTHMRHVSSGIARRFMDKLAGEGTSPNTFNKYRGFLLMVFRVLAREGRVPVNPWAEIKTRQLQTIHRRALTVDELRAVCGKATGEMRLLLALGVYTGARLGDCCTMTWGSVDLGRGEVRYSPRKTSSRTDDKALTVPLHPVLAAMLAETPLEKRKGYVLPDYAAHYLGKGPANITQKVQAHFESCDLVTTVEGRGKRKRAAVEVGFHSLRHTAVSLLRDSGASMAAAMAITGHTSAALLDQYTHAGRDTIRAAVAALPAIGGNYTPPPSEADRWARVRELAGQLKGKTWKKVQAELLSLAG